MANISDRIVSGITYFTFGIFGIIWLIYVNVAKKQMSPFVLFNIMQSCFITVLLAVIGYAYSIILNLILAIPVIGNMFKNFDLFFNGTPIYLGYSVSGLFMTILTFYLIIFSLLGKRPFVPFISPIIKANVRG